jgi:hypothetical protein
MEDGALWLAYETSDDGAARAVLAKKIVETHLPFLRYYAAQTAFPYWSDQIREEYVQELVIVAMGKVPTYNRLRIGGSSGKVAKFVTYLKPYLQGVRWDISAREAPIPVGRETRRMRADAQRFIRDRQAEGDDPTWDEVAEAVSRAHGKTVSPTRIERIVNGIQVVSGDAITGEDGEELWAVEAPAAASFADEVVDGVARDRLSQAVQETLADLDLDELDRAIVTDRLMAPPAERAAHQELAQWFEVNLVDVAARERVLVEQLRRHLGPLL